MGVVLYGWVPGLSYLYTHTTYPYISTPNYIWWIIPYIWDRGRYIPYIYLPLSYPTLILYQPLFIGDVLYNILLAIYLIYYNIIWYQYIILSDIMVVGGPYNVGDNVVYIGVDIYDVLVHLYWYWYMVWVFVGILWVFIIIYAGLECTGTRSNQRPKKPFKQDHYNE